MNTTIKGLTCLAIGAFCLSVIFAPWNETIMAGNNSVSLRTIYSPVWKPPTTFDRRPATTPNPEKRPFTSAELNDMEKAGYDTSKYDGTPIDFSAVPAAQPRLTSINLRFDSLLFEWAAIAIIYFGVFFMLKPKRTIAPNN